MTLFDLFFDLFHVKWSDVATIGLFCVVLFVLEWVLGKLDPKVVERLEHCRRKVFNACEGVGIVVGFLSLIVLSYLIAFLFALLMINSSGYLPIIDEHFVVVNNETAVCEGNYRTCHEEITNPSNAIKSIDVNVKWDYVDCGSDPYNHPSLRCNGGQWIYWMQYIAWFHVATLKTIIIFFKGIAHPS